MGLSIRRQGDRDELVFGRQQPDIARASGVSHVSLQYVSIQFCLENEILGCDFGYTNLIPKDPVAWLGMPLALLIRIESRCDASERHSANRYRRLSALSTLF